MVEHALDRCENLHFILDGAVLLVIVLDDVGIDQIGRWNVGAVTAPTPTIDCLCNRGTRFTAAWADAVCSPSRAELLTGRLSLRTGIGHNVPREGQLAESEQTFAELLADSGYSTALVGKWHLGSLDSPDGLDGPNLQGFQHFAGSLENLSWSRKGPRHHGNYYHWLKVVDGTARWSDKYATEDTADEAVDFIGDTVSPWVLMVSFNAPHEPVEPPPQHLLSKRLKHDATWDETYRAMLEAADTEIGKILRSMDPEVLANTVVVVLGDNGTPSEDIVPPLDGDEGKNTLSEGGVRIPLVLSGPGIRRGAVSRSLVHVTDVFPTLAELAGAGPATNVLDGDSLVGVLDDPDLPVHDTLSNALFDGRLGAPGWSVEEAVRDDGYKLMVGADGTESLVQVDDETLYQSGDLLGGDLSESELAELAKLRVAIGALPPPSDETETGSR